MSVSAKQAQKIMEKIAQENGITVFEVRREIEKAIEAGMKSTDPTALCFWGSVPRSGTTPTPEEVMTYMALLAK